MLPAFDVAHREPEPVATCTTATNRVKPFRSRLKPSSPCRSILADFTRRFPAEGHVWPQRVVPTRVQTNLASHCRKRGWNKKAPHAFVFHRSYEAFDDGDACRLADGSVARPDGSSLAPAFEATAPELHALVGHDVLRRLPIVPNGTIEEALDLIGRGQLGENRKPDGGLLNSVAQYSSYDIYFAPKTPAGKESNWIQTLPGKGWNMLWRIYGPTKPWYDRSWKIGDPEVVR